MSSTRGLSYEVWIKSSYSGNGGANCLEWAPACVSAGVVPVRDSKEPEGPALAFGLSAWAGFIASVRQDQFGA